MAEGTAGEEAGAEDDGAICWICAEPVKYYSVSACNHRTCHVCALRLRALYKKLDCTFCKEPQSTVIFTTSADTPFAEYTPEMISHKDTKLSISFETAEMMEETLILLRFNCPVTECDYTATGWGDLKLHTRGVHGKVICDLCIRHKKVFAHEHTLYPPSILPLHLPSMPHRSNRKHDISQEKIEGGVHPMCQFCRECFFSDDELFSHMREKHEECFVCRRNEVIFQYFQNYEALEQHFNQAHHPCTNARCQAQKFVVFGSTMDLQAHMVEEHGGEMTARDKREALRIQAEFEFQDGGGGGGGGGGRRRRGRGGNGAEDSAQDQTQQQAPPRRRREFGGRLTTDDGGSGLAPQPAFARPNGLPVTPGLEESDPVAAERDSALAARIAGLAPNPTHAVAALRLSLRAFRAGESSARDLISTAWNVLDRHLDHTASAVNALVDALGGDEEEEKKAALLEAWNGFKLEQRAQFPDLVPREIGGGYAGIASGRVINAKHATQAGRRGAGGARQGQVWDRVAAAASSSSAGPPTAFPALPGPSRPSPVPTPRPPAASAFPALGGGSSGGSGGRPSGARNTPWASSASASPAPSAQAGFRAPSAVPTPVSVPGPGASAGGKKGKGGGPPALSNAAFPGLPSNSTGQRAKPSVRGNTSLKKILGESAPAGNVWGGGSGSNGPGDGAGSWAVPPAAGGDGEAQGGGGGGKGKKSKGKQKQTLFTLGAFPS
ncbi:hypothetical protein CONPUDRAFT_47956 [Coniophora puteana RWD-64-598 SS2]|uniref:RING-type E3 ubiquitin transferase n=1 Tax=Coniophora puteana (strain RWD-64-598) TaxID=741705 RepID=A0A5M3N100_CONPW|nr:uncharacterized protein CONPUDRAFT_47956 [Coniophora puteana RWD-64-598 SS2]EIW84684.1 hypothetical protein CONPUDRAFT_47956 [Coniophora puteana RWD-64-598 SS2]